MRTTEELLASLRHSERILQQSIAELESETAANERQLGDLVSESEETAVTELESVTSELESEIVEPETETPSEETPREEPETAVMPVVLVEVPPTPKETTKKQTYLQRVTADIGKIFQG